MAAATTVEETARILTSHLLPEIFHRIPIFMPRSALPGRELDMEVRIMHVTVLREERLPSSPAMHELAQRLRIERPVQGFYSADAFNEHDLMGADGRPTEFAAYLQRLEATVEDKMRTAMARDGKRMETFEDAALLQARLTAAQDYAIMRAEPSLVMPDDVETMMRFHYAGELALRSMRNVVQLRPDCRPARYLSRDVSNLVLCVTSDDLFVGYISVYGHGSARSDTMEERERMRMKKFAPGPVLTGIAEAYKVPVDVLFPPLRPDINEGSIPQQPYNTTHGPYRTRIISIGLLPIVMAHMDPRFTCLNPVANIGRAVIDYIRPLLESRFSDPVHRLQYEQLEHNMRWISDVQYVDREGLALATRLPGYIHAHLLARLAMRRQYELALIRQIVGRDAEGRAILEKIEAVAEQKTTEALGRVDVPATDELADPVVAYLRGRLAEINERASSIYIKHSESARARWSKKEATPQETKKKKEEAAAVGDAPTKKRKRPAAKKKEEEVGSPLSSSSSSSSSDEPEERETKKPRSDKD